MVGQRGMPAHDSRPLGVGSSPVDRKTRGRVTRSTTRSSVGESARPGSPPSALARARTSTSRASSSRSTTNAMKREVGSDTATTVADVSRKVRSARTSASRGGRARMPGARNGAPDTGRSPYWADRVPDPVGGRNEPPLDQIRRHERERLDDASRGGFGDGECVAAQRSVAGVDLFADRLRAGERSRSMVETLEVAPPDDPAKVPTASTAPATPRRRVRRIPTV